MGQAGQARSAPVVGFRPHTYWAAAVVLAGGVDAPTVVRRARIDFAQGETRNVFHHAAELSLEDGAAWAERVRLRTTATATQAIGDLLAALRVDGEAPLRAVVPAGGGRAPERLEDIVRSHSAMHAAEGEFYRNVVAASCEAVGLAVTRVIERELPSLAADALGESVEAVKARLQAMGQRLGPPWSEDQKLATLAAWVGLAGAE
jgi:hypothetical protein